MNYPSLSLKHEGGGVSASDPGSRRNLSGMTVPVWLRRPHLSALSGSGAARHARLRFGFRDSAHCTKILKIKTGFSSRTGLS